MGKSKFTSATANARTRELFESTITYEYDKLLKKEELIFEGINYNIDASKLFEEFFEDREDGYIALLQEDASQRKAYIKDYFYGKTITPIFESYQKHINLEKIQCIEEGTDFYQSFSDKVKLETTAKFLIENILDFLPKDKRIEITEDILLSHELKLRELQEAIDNGNAPLARVGDTLQNSIDQIIGTVTGTARLLKEMVLGLIVFLYSPFMIISSENIKYKIFGTSGKGKIKQFLELVGPCQNIGELLLGQYSEIGEILKKVNEIDSEEVKSFLNEVSQDKNIREKVINDCWLKSAKVPSISETGQTGLVKFIHVLGNFMQSGRMTWLGNPQDSGKGLLGFLFAMDADNPNFQRSFFEFRKCTYDHIFTLIQGYAKTAAEIEITNIEILERIKVASKRKDFKAFDHIKQEADDSENLMYKVGKVLLSIDELAESLKQNKRLLYQDQYIDQFYIYLKQKIKQTFLDLDEISSRASTKNKEKKYTEGEHPDDKYDENWKDHSLSTIRHGHKPKKIKSIYDV
jgi:Asp-tRNA(Asn)/Glu-tRNA(Gln) amidotransferase C subunit